VVAALTSNRTMPYRGTFVGRGGIEPAIDPFAILFLAIPF
jgi:hypothetical protein